MINALIFFMVFFFLVVRFMSVNWCLKYDWLQFERRQNNRSVTVSYHLNRGCYGTLPLEALEICLGNYPLDIGKFRIDASGALAEDFRECKKHPKGHQSQLSKKILGSGHSIISKRSGQK